MRWKTMIAGTAGASHRARHLPCQDYGQVRVFGHDTLVAAIADGAGSAVHSARGAHLAASMAVRSLSDLFTTADRIDNPRAARQMKDAVESARERLEVEASHRLCRSRDFACTLLAVVATESQLFALQLGDGFWVVRWHGQQEYELLFPSDRGEYINETSFVTDRDSVIRMRMGFWNRSAAFICGSTDGLEPLAIEYRRQKPSGPFFAPLDTFIRENLGRGTAKCELLDFLDSERVNARVDDDKTLLLACGE